MHNTKKYQGGVLKSFFRHLTQSLAAQRLEGRWLQWLTWRFRAAAGALWWLGRIQGTERLSVLSHWALPLRQCWFSQWKGVHTLLQMKWGKKRTLVALQWKEQRYRLITEELFLLLQLAASRCIAHRLRQLLANRTKKILCIATSPSADLWRGGALCG